MRTVLGVKRKKFPGVYPPGGLNKEGREGGARPSSYKLYSVYV